MAQKEFERGAGILMHISSLPSPYGIGSFGKDAYEFVDRLVGARQKYWQVLPLGKTSYGDSPYASFSAFAGNPYFIDLDTLIEEGLITKEYVDSFRWNIEEQYVDYGLIYNSRFIVLKEAYKNSNHKALKEYKEFVKENDFWIDDYCLYCVCKNDAESTSWQDWEEDIRFRKQEALDKKIEEFSDELDFYRFLQFKFFEQWFKLKEYANEKGIEIIGDIPIYVAMDSADVWSHPEIFQLDENLEAKKVAGVPPDAFSDLGQRWGNPLYDWNKLEKDDFSWWRKRMEHSAKLYDIVRIDHFIGMTKYYTIPAEDEDARNGKWEKGPGMKLIKAISQAIGDKKIIAEDLGVKIPEVVEVLEKSGFPGMKVLEFAFDSREKSDYLPYTYEKNSVVYTGTHDNMTLQGWYHSLSPASKTFALRYLGNAYTPEGEIHWDYIRLALASVAKLAVIPVQDYLGLGNWARTNEPSTLGKNWRWRMKKDDLTPELIAKCREMAEIYGRAKKVQADLPEKERADKDTREMQEERPAEKEEKPTAKEERRSADEAPQ